MNQHKDELPQLSTEEDLRRVFIAQYGEQRMDIMDRLNRGTASVEDAFLFAQSADPLEEANGLLYTVLPKENEQGFYEHEMFARFRAAETLITDVMKLDFAEPAADGLNPSDRISVSTLKFEHDVSNGTHYTTDQLRQLVVGAEMLDMYVAQNQWCRRLYKDQYDDPLIEQTMKASHDEAVRNSARVRMAVATDALGVDDARLEHYGLGLKSLWSTGVNLLPDDGTDDAHARRSTVIAAMIHELKKVFIDRGMLTSKDETMSDKKGTLHELMWMIDGYMLILSDDKLKHINIMQSPTGFDRPLIGKPVIRRAYDYYLIHHDVNKEPPVEGFILGSEYVSRVQLKTGSQQRYEYHPDIRIARDENFMDVNPRRLTRKLAEYTRIINSGFQAADTSTTILYYALWSVVTEIEALAA